MNTLLDFSRIEAGRVEATYEPVDLAEFTTELASVFRAAIDKAGLQYAVDCEDIGEPVYVDREMWEKIVLNLISNAFKFTLTGQIGVRVNRDGSRALLTVRDTGSGISASELPHVFEHVFEFANDSYLEVAGRTAVVGRTVRDVFPELEGQGIYELLDTVHTSGQPFMADSMRLQMRRRGAEALEEVYFKFVYQPMPGPSGEIEGIAIVATEVTDLANARRDAERAVQNLLTNAATYTEPGGRIRIAGRRVEQSIELVLEDNGVGIPADMLPRVFDLFVQGRQSADRSKGGLGLGLTLVRTLVELHRGTVEARSEGTGRGSQFVVRLPAAAPAAVAAAPRGDGRREDTTSRGIRGLIVDDNQDAASMLTEAMQSFGYDTRFALDGPSALDVATRFKPHVVLLDLGLPGDGWLRGRRSIARRWCLGATHCRHRIRSRSRPVAFTVGGVRCTLRQARRSGRAPAFPGAFARRCRRLVNVMAIVRRQPRDVKARPVRTLTLGSISR